MSTKDIHYFVSDVKDDDEFYDFINNNCNIFFNTFSKLINFIDEKNNGNAYMLKERTDEQSNVTFHKFIEINDINPIFETALSKLRVHNILPSRNLLIALGVHMNLSVEDINKMLSLAKMNPLYAKDKLDCLIMFLLAKEPDDVTIRIKMDSDELRNSVDVILENNFNGEVELSSGDFYLLSEYIKYALAGIEECSEFLSLL